jgi:predicted Zn-dependent protease with MMP-like domain
MSARRDRHGRGLRSSLAPRAVPIAHSPTETFDAAILDALEHLEAHGLTELADVEFAVEDVPDVPVIAGGADVLADAGVPLAQAHPRGLGGVSGPLVVLYRRPLESRAMDAEDLGALIENVVIDRVAHLLGRDPADLDPHYDDRDD